MHSSPALIIIVFFYILEFIIWAKKILSFHSVHQQLANLRGNLVEVMSNVTFFICNKISIFLAVGMVTKRRDRSWGELMLHCGW